MFFVGKHPASRVNSCQRKTHLRQNGFRVLPTPSPADLTFALKCVIIDVTVRAGEFNSGTPSEAPTTYEQGISRKLTVNSMALKTQNIALRLNAAHVQAFRQHAGFRRFVYNYALSAFKEGLEAGEWRSGWTIRKDFNARKKTDFSWHSSLIARVASHAFDDFDKACQRWKNKLAKFPRYKRKSGKQSFRVDNKRNSVRFEGKRILLPKIGWVRTFETLRFVGDIMRVVIKKRGHRWFASLLIETEEIAKPDLRGLPTVGVDVGINSLATLSDGRVFENPRPFRRLQRKLARLQRSLSRSEFLSANWHKKKAKVTRLHYRISCIREDAHHKASSAIVQGVSVIGIETLRVTNMLKNRRLAKALSDSALGGLLSQIETKAAALGVEIVKADAFYASSKTCSECGHKKEMLTLSERQYECESCGVVLDRDLNAARNLNSIAAGLTEM